MRYEVVSLLKCPVCGSQKLQCIAFSEQAPREIKDGLVWCGACKNWFPVVDGLLEFLTGSLVYAEDREQFWATYSEPLEKIGLSLHSGMQDQTKRDLQLIQQSHFDWYATNDLQTYSNYAQQSFWLAADQLAFEPWRKGILPGSWLLDVGCADGRSAFKLMDLEINVVGFDVSKSLVRQAMDRYRSGAFNAKATFFVADANHFPFRDSSFDYVLIYGVLHHLPDPICACQEVARVLKLHGKYLGSENNASVFRVLFDFLQRINPLWHEEAGPEALISHHLIYDAFKNTNMELKTYTSVFLPPHLLNLFSQKIAERFLSVSDRIVRKIPVLRDNGGLILINGTKIKEE